MRLLHFILHLLTRRNKPDPVTPCPFRCGAETYPRRTYGAHGFTYWYFHCPKCKANGPDASTKVMARRRWLKAS